MYKIWTACDVIAKMTSFFKNTAVMSQQWLHQLKSNFSKNFWWIPWLLKTQCNAAKTCAVRPKMSYHDRTWKAPFKSMQSSCLTSTVVPTWSPVWNGTTALIKIVKLLNVSDLATSITSKVYYLLLLLCLLPVSITSLLPFTDDGMGVGKGGHALPPWIFTHSLKPTKFQKLFHF